MTGSEEPSNVPEVTRRRLLGTLGAATVPLAGCPFPGDGGDSTATPTAGPVTTPAGTATPVSELTGGFSDRVTGILDEMSTREQAGQTVLHAARRNSATEIESTIASVPLGGILYGGARAPSPRDAGQVAATFNGFQRTALESSDADVPLVIGIDAVHGNATVQPAAVFPHNVGMGATWDDALAERVGAVTARSMRSLGMHWNFAPAADLAYDPRWGRFYECLSQDPLVASRLAAALVRGFQTPTETGRTAATVKHFGGYSFPETGNDRSNVDLSQRRLRERALPPYRAGVDAGAETVMATSAAINGVPAHASDWLLAETLRERWDFAGLVTSDWEQLWQLYAGHEFVNTYRDAIRVGFSAGLDVAMAPRNVERYVELLTDLVDAGDLSESRLRTAAGRMLQLKERLGLFEDPTVDEARVSSTVATPEDRELAREAARKSMTILRSGPLPIDDDASILLTGPNANSITAQCGGWTMGWQGFPEVGPLPAATVLGGMNAFAPEDATIDHVPTGRRSFESRDAVESAAAEADVAVVVLGEGAYAEYEGDVDELALPAAQRELVSVVAEAAPTTVGVVLAGRPRGSPSLFDHLDGLVMGYYPGTTGGRVVTETLFGRNPHRGALPFTWPTSIGQGPASEHERRAIHALEEPLFGFGTGAHVDGPATIDALEPSTVGPDGSTTLEATVSVTNDDDRRRSRPIVVQGIATNEETDVRDSTVIPAMGVVGFDRVSVDAGSTASRTISVDLAALGTVGGGVTGDGEWQLPAGRYRLWVADSTTSVDVTETVPLE